MLCKYTLISSIYDDDRQTVATVHSTRPFAPPNTFAAQGRENGRRKYEQVSLCSKTETAALTLKTFVGLP